MSNADIPRLLQEEAELAEKERHVERSYVRPRAPESPSQVYSLRIPVERLEQLRQLAAARDEAPTTMMRRWVLERLDRELARAIRREPAARFDELFDQQSVRALESIFEAAAASRDYVVRDSLTEKVKELHRQLYATLESFAEMGSIRQVADKQDDEERQERPAS
ncbi:MAG: hypothetical protein M3O70_08395 [Actinomycetota bacterium]|nr:hypothetical protein [Actinomycetota bacterium]